MQSVSSFQRSEEFAANVRGRREITVDGWFAARSVQWTETMYENRQQLDEPWTIIPSCQPELLEAHTV